MTAEDPRPARRSEQHVAEDVAQVAEDLAVLARAVVPLAASSARIGAWAALTGMRAGRRAVDVMRHPERTEELADDLRAAASAITRALDGSRPGSRPGGRPGIGMERPGASALHRPLASEEPEPLREAVVVEPVNPLHQAGRELLRRSRDLDTDDRGHPAYARIIEQLAPDEARILMLLLHTGPQPSIDVRTGGLLGTVSSTLVAAGLNMIGSRAGCRYVDRVPSYLHNLGRLGLVWFSRETLQDPAEYQVLEAQPDVLEAIHRVRRAKVVRRSIHLTPFGEDFCRDGLGLDLTPEELAEMPRHGLPGE